MRKLIKKMFKKRIKLVMSKCPNGSYQLRPKKRKKFLNFKTRKLLFSVLLKTTYLATWLLGIYLFSLSFKLMEY